MFLEERVNHLVDHYDSELAIKIVSLLKENRVSRGKTIATLLGIVGIELQEVENKSFFLEAYYVYMLHVANAATRPSAN